MRPVELLEQNDQSKLVRKRERSKGQSEVRLWQRWWTERAADDEREVTAAATARLEEAAEVEAVSADAVERKQAQERPSRQPPCDRVCVAHLYEIETHVPAEQLAIMLDIVEVGRTQTSLPDDRHSHA